MENNQKTEGMQITLINEAEGNMYNIWLPDGEPKGRYTFAAFGVDCFYIEAYKEAWHAICKNGAVFENCADDMKYCIPLASDSFIKIFDGQRHFALFAQKLSDDNMVFSKFIIGKKVESITIGRNRDNDICVGNGMVSGNHAVLEKAGNRWQITDLDSTHGTFCNCRRIKKAALRCGDVVYIVGLKIIIGVDFLALNMASGNRLVLNPQIFNRTNRQSAYIGEAVQQQEEQLYNRLPRKRMALKFDTIQVEAPPMSMRNNKMPFLLRSANSLVMGTTALMAGRITSVLTSLLFPFLTNNYTEKERKEYEDKRKSLYLDYLNRKNCEIQEERQKEETTLKWNYPNLESVLEIAQTGTRLWERKKFDDDFLSIRIGEGERNLLAEITYPREQLSMEEDELETAMRSLVQTPVKLNGVPIQTSLVDDFVCGVSGLYAERVKFVRNFILQLAITHSYDEVKLIFLADEMTMNYFQFVRYLPHIWNDERDFRFLATNLSEAYRIGEYLQKEMESTDKEGLEEILKTRPFYVVVSFDKKCFDGMEILKDVLQEKENQGVAVVAAFPDLPKECSKIFRLSDQEYSEVIHIRDLDSENEKFLADEFNPYQAEAAIRRIANTKLRTVEQAYALPKMLTFLQMFGVGKIEHLNIENRWKNSNPVQSLATPIGVATDGSLFMLDLHQRFQGPHGLVAGTTGSGKSEFLLTYILSMAVNYHPDEVAFVLIDYKGGGLAGAFDDPEHGVHLPHLVGTITNLDGASIQRSLVSIQSELIRRQRIFNEVKTAIGEGTMDIYTYQKAYRNGLVKDPLPHLFIISDEFAELKQQEPEFMDKLISAARIGRSLGIHLILATQKPSGVVNDQIRSNTKFRVCLKVQDKADSNDMLKRPEAAELKDTGRFYLQVGYNEFFALGQSAWSGADYEPKEEVTVRKDESLQLIDGNGQNIVEVRKKQQAGKASGSQLVAVVNYISEIARRDNIEVRQLWKPAVSEELTYEDTLKELPSAEPGETVETVVGMVDDPENQTQFPLSIDLQNCGNMLILGESGCGKSTFLQTMLYDLTGRYSPEKVQYYIVDCSSHSLRIFRDAPHCGAWLSEEKDGDIDRLFRLLDEQIKKRKKLFAQEDVSSYDMYIRKKSLPLLIYVIDNMAGLAATPKGDTYYSGIAEYMKRCSGLGIQFVITASHLNELYSKTKQEIATRVALEQKDKYGYGDVLNSRCEYLPAKNKGHGMVCINDRLLEFQTALMTAEKGTDEDLKAMVDRACQPYGSQVHAERLQVLDLEQTYEDFLQEFAKGRIPIGYAIHDVKPVALPIKQLSMLSIYMGNDNGRKAVMQNLVKAGQKNGMEILVVKKQEGSCFADETAFPGVKTIECSEEALYDFILDMTAKIGPRIETLQAYTRAHGLKASRSDIYKDTYSYMSENVQPIFVILESFGDLYKAIKEEANDKAMAKLFHISRNVGIYYAAGFYPGEKSNSAYEITSAYNPEKIEIYLGGRYEQQDMGRLPSEFSRISKEQPYNKGLMRYKDEFHAIFMPCGILEQKEVNEDDRDIFS